MNSRALSVPRKLAVALMPLLLVLPALAAGQGNGRQVGAERTNVLRVGPGQKYATIQVAVDAARRGSTILVYPGTYPESVSVTKNDLQIIARGENVVVVPPATAGFSVHADHVTIRGFAIAYGANCAPGISFEGSHNVFADNAIYLAAGCPGVNAIACRDKDGGSDYNVVERNTIDRADIGIVIAAETVAAVNTGNVIRDNTLRSVAQDPIAIANGRGFLVSGNRISGAPYGICIAVGTLGGNQLPQGHHTIIGNTVRDCGDNGISLYAWPGTVLTHNRIVHNTIENCVGDCLALEAGSGATLTHNEVVGNRVSSSLNASGLLLAAGPGALVGDNTIRDNLVHHHARNGISLTSSTGDALSNPSGVTGAGNTIGANNNRILGNEVQTNNNVGIAVVGDDNLIAGNRIHDNSMDLADLGDGNTWRNNRYTPTVGWAVGDSSGGYGTILHTIDGGKTWARQGSPTDIPATELMEVSAVDANVAWVVGVNAILRTSDGGQTWESQTLPADLPDGFQLHGIKAIDASTAFVVGVGVPSVLLQTTNGGATWSSMPRGSEVPDNFDSDDLDAADASHVWAAGATNARGEAIMLFYNGVEWHVQPTALPKKNGDAFIGVTAIDSLHAWAVGGMGIPMATTADGGATWQITNAPVYPWDMNRVVAVNTTTGWIAGDDGVVKYTVDAGTTWHAGTPNLPSAYLFGITAISEQSAWVVGLGLRARPPGTIARTIDATNWKAQSDPSWPNMRGISFVGARR